jgi:hypothetical protein
MKTNLNEELSHIKKIMGLNEQNSGWFDDEEPEVDNNIEPEVIQDNDIEPNSDGEFVKNIQFLGKNEEIGSMYPGYVTMVFDIPIFTTKKGYSKFEDLQMCMLTLQIFWNVERIRRDDDGEIKKEFKLKSVEFELWEKVKLELLKWLNLISTFKKLVEIFYKFKPYTHFTPTSMAIELRDEEKFYSDIEKDIKLLNSHMEYHTNLYLKKKK